MGLIFVKLLFHLHLTEATLSQIYSFLMGQLVEVEMFTYSSPLPLT
jgi:hypothetical protein